MIPELLVAFACLNSTGCTETTNLYYSTNPQVKVYLLQSKKELTKLLGPNVVATVPILTTAIHGSGTLKLNKKLGLQFNSSGGLIMFETSF